MNITITYQDEGNWTFRSSSIQKIRHKSQNFVEEAKQEKQPKEEAGSGQGFFIYIKLEYRSGCRESVYATLNVFGRSTFLM